jgi:hypothetical protein
MKADTNIEVRGVARGYRLALAFVFNIAACPVRAQAALDFAFAPIPLKP